MGPDDHLLISMSHSSLRPEEGEYSLSTLDSDSTWESRRQRPLCGPCQTALNYGSQRTLRVFFVGTLLAAVHVIGILISSTEMIS